MPRPSSRKPLKLFLTTTVFCVAVLGTLLGIAIAMDTLSNKANDEAHSAAIETSIKEKQEAAEEKEKAERQKALNQCLDIVNQHATKALGDVPVGTTPESAAAYQSAVLQLQQNGIQDCKARFGSL